MHRTRAYRRDKALKRKRDVVQWMKQWNPRWWHRGGSLEWDDPRAVGRWAKTPTMCSGVCCGNIRHKWDMPTEQEAKNMLTALDDIEEIGYNSRVMKKAVVRHAEPWDYD